MSDTRYIQLVGLLTLAENHRRQLEEIERAVKGICDTSDTRGYVSDAVWSGERTADYLAQLYKIPVTTELARTEGDDDG